MVLRNSGGHRSALGRGGKISMRIRHHIKTLRIAAMALIGAGLAGAARAEDNPDKLLWGDTHLHTNLSTDAYFFGNRTADADTAYRFAKGQGVIHPYHRATVRLETPLDFLAVTDHAGMLGVPYSLFTDRDPRLTKTRLGKRLIALAEAGREEDAFAMFLYGLTTLGSDPADRPKKVGLATLIGWRIADLVSVGDERERALRWLASDPTLTEEIQIDEVSMSHWRANIEAAERHNDPGEFTTLIGWEYTPTPDGQNLHRVVLTPDGADKATQFLPFSAQMSANPEDLWVWLGETKAATGADFVSIPHNSNVSKGAMFARTTTAGDPIDEGYARLRMTWETVAEVTQIKGTSETHPILSPDDEFADFEFFNALLEVRADGSIARPGVEEGSYLRSALKTGLEIDNAVGVTPYKFGMIGATDSHAGPASAEEDNFMGKMAIDSIPETKEAGFVQNVSGWEMSASGLAAVWARENNRQEIIAAFKRREVYGTTGPRMAVRFFGGYDFEAADLDARDLAAVGYAKGVPMGGDLTAAAAAPSFLVHAVKDPKGANLDRVQIVKGWLDADGEAQEKVFNIAWAGARQLDGQGTLPAVGDTVDRRTGNYENSIGEPELLTIWRDPEFDADARAFYYVRVLQIPTPRNSLYDAIALQQDPPEGYADVIQERAYTSPIWYTPG